MADMTSREDNPSLPVDSRICSVPTNCGSQEYLLTVPFRVLGTDLLLTYR